MPNAAVPGAGAPHRPRRAGVPGPAPHHPDDAHVLAHADAHRRAPGRLGQRAPAGPLHAAVLADGALRHRHAQAGVGAEAAADGGVLGARAGVHAGRPVAGDAAPDERLPREPALGCVDADQPRAGRAGPRAGARPGGRRRPATSTTAARARRSTGAGTGPRRARPSTTSSWWATSRSPGATPVRAGLRPAPSGCCRRRCSRRRCRTQFEATKELIRRAARSHGVATVRCLTDYYRLQLQRGEGTKAAAGRRSTSWSRTASCCR